MTVATPLALRWERAQQIDRATIEDMGQGWYYVPSSRGVEGYAVQLEFDSEGKLTTASCTCPDFAKRMDDTGAPMLNAVRICKHVLAASLKAKDRCAQVLTNKSEPHTVAKAPSSQTVPGCAIQIPVAVSVLPTAGEPLWDAECEEWVLTDSSGLHYCGASPSECARQFQEARHYQAEHASKDRSMIAELSEVRAQDVSVVTTEREQGTQPSKVVLDEDRRHALSRARGIANQERSPLLQAYRLYGVGPGDVLDWVAQSMFLAVISLTPEGLIAQAVAQDNPSGTVREIRMKAKMLHLRLQQGWLTKVRDLRR